MAQSNQSLSNNQVTSTTSSATPPNDGDYLASFKRVEAEIRAVPEDQLEVVNIDVPAAVTTVVGAMSEILAFRGAMAELGGFDIALVDKLQDYAQACGHAHGLYRIATGPKDPVTKLGGELTAIRDLLFSDAVALSKRGLLSESVVAPLRSPAGYRNIAYDTISLVALFREHAQALAGKTPVSSEELNGAIRTAEELLAAIGEREQTPPNSAAAVLLRQQAFTLFINAYDQVRRAIGYLRWSTNDAETIAPSLWAGRGKRPSRQDETTTTTTTTTTTPDTAPTSTAPTGTAAVPTVGTNAATPAATPAIAVGLPGSPPFTK